VTGRFLFLGWLCLVIVAAACSKDAASNERICTPGNYVYCRCKDRSEGTKLCLPDGTGFDPCENCLSGSEDNRPGDTEPDANEDAKPDDAAVVEEPPPVTGERPKPGTLLITEILYDPSGNEPTDEWFEVLNIGTTTVTMNGILLRDGANRVHLLDGSPSMLLPPNQPLVLTRNRAAAVASGVPSARILGEYGTGDSDTGGVLLTNGVTGALALLDGATELVRVSYGSFGFVQTPPGGASIQLKTPSLAQANVAAGWCLSSAAWSGQPVTKSPKDKGSPGAPSTCP
jgi:hypothetical protein